VIVLGLTLAIAGALATIVEPARAAFDRVPAELDLQQRGRTAIEVLSQALRSAINNVTLSDPGADGLFGTLTVTVPFSTPGIAPERYIFRLAAQPDGSYSLIRETSAGAIQPVIDFVSALSFSVSGAEVNVVVRLQASTASLRRVITERVFRSSVRMRNAS